MSENIRSLLLKILISSAFLLSCKSGWNDFMSSDKTRSSASADALKASDRPSDSSGGVPGYLTFGCRLGFTDEGMDVYSSCVAQDSQGKANLQALAGSWNFRFVLPEYAPAGILVTITELPQENPQHVVYRFSGKPREELLNIAMRTSFMLDLRLKDQESTVTLGETRERLTDISAAPRYRYIRISFPSLKQPWMDTQELDIEQLELKWENQWRVGVFSDYSGRLGPYEAIVSASSYATDRSSFPYFAFQRGPQGNIWETAFRTYETTGQYNAIGTPQWLKIDFKDYPIALQGIRLDGGDSKDTNGSEGSPDAFYIEGSQDNLSWTLIKGSLYENVDTTRLSTFEWE
jgi:hypothetical protein